MTDARYEAASQYAEVLAAKAEELSQAIYEAHKMGYRVALRIDNVITVSNRDGGFRCIGADDCVRVQGSIPFDIGLAIL